MTTELPATEPGLPPSAESPVDPAHSPPAASPRPAWLLPTATGVAGVLLGVALTVGVTSVRAGAAESALFTEAVEACVEDSAYGVELADEGRSITFDMKGEDDLIGAEMSDIACVFAELDIPTAVSSHISQTTSMDGRQTETWDNITVSWSYHPDRGLDGVLTVADD